MDVRLPNHQSDAARTLDEGESVHMCFQTCVRHRLDVLACFCVAAAIIMIRHIDLQMYCTSSSQEGHHFLEHHSKAKQNQVCQTQIHTKELLGNTPLMKQSPFKIYERVLQRNYNWPVITLAFSVVASCFRKLSVRGVWRWCIEFTGD